jgi:hypothetical protein
MGICCKVVANKRVYLLSAVPGTEHDVPGALLPQLVEQMIEERSARDRRENLRNV